MEQKLRFLERKYIPRGEYDLSPDFKIASWYLVLSLLHKEETYISGVKINDYLNDCMELVRFLGAKVELYEDEISIRWDEVTSHAVTDRYPVDFDFKWFLALGILFSTGRSGFQVRNLSPSQRDCLNVYLDHLLELGVAIEEENDFLLFGMNRDITPLEVEGVDMSGYTTVEIIGFAMFYRIFNNRLIQLKKCGLDYQTYYFLSQQEFVQIESVDELYTVEIDPNYQIQQPGYLVPKDQIEATMLIIYTVLTNGDLVINGVDNKVLMPIFNILNQLGIEYKYNENVMNIWVDKALNIGKFTISSGNYPGMNVEMLHLMSLITLRSNQYVNIYYQDTIFNFEEIINEFHALGMILSDLYQEGVNQIAGIQVHGFDLRTNPQLDLNQFNQVRLAMLFGIVNPGIEEIFHIEKFNRFYPEFIPKIIQLGCKCEVNEING